LDPSFSVGSVLFHGNHLFGVRPGVGGALSVYEVSGTTLPKPVASTNLIAYIADQAIAGNLLYVLAAGIGMPGVTPDPDGLLVFDISDPIRPTRQGQYRLTGDPQALAVTNHFGYVAHGTNGLTVLALANPEQIRVAAQIAADGFAKHVVLAKGCAFVGTNADGVRIYDLSDPVAPRLLGAIQPGQDAASLAIVDDTAFVGSESIQAYDIRDPARPRLVGGYTTILQPRFTRQSFTADGDLVVGSLQDGVCRLRLRPFFRSRSWTNHSLSFEWYPIEGVRLETSPRSIAPQWSDLTSGPPNGRATVPTEGPYRQFRLTRP